MLRSKFLRWRVPAYDDDLRPPSTAALSPVNLRTNRTARRIISISGRRDAELFRRISYTGFGSRYPDLCLKRARRRFRAASQSACGLQDQSLYAKSDPTMDVEHRSRSESALAASPYRSKVQAMAWFSLALGIAELAAPRQAARVAGSPLPAGLVRAMGAREIANGVGLLTQPRSARWMWARVAGDAIDLALLALALLNRLPLLAK